MNVKDPSKDTEIWLLTSAMGSMEVEGTRILFPKRTVGLPGSI